MSIPPPVDFCTVDTDCPPGYYCDAGTCVPYGGGGVGEDPPAPPLPGLGNWLTPRYTSNLVVSEQLPIMDLIQDVLLPACRGYFRQTDTGRIGMRIKQPVPFGYSTAAVAVDDTSLDIDNVRQWIGSTDSWLLIAPHTNKSEVHRVSSANYSTAQNSVTISSTGGIFTTVNFSGCDGADTPATGSITVDSATTGDCSITIGGKTFEFSVTSSNTTESIAAYIAGVIRVHPALNRKYGVTYTEGDSVVNLTALFGTLTLDGPMINSHTAPLVDPVTPPSLSASGSGSSLAAGTYSVGYSVANDDGETLLSKYKQITITAGQNIVVASQSLPTGGTAFNWYISPGENSSDLRYYSTDTGAGFTISGSLPKLTATLTPDLNRTGVEVMRVSAVFTDREETRTNLTGANVLKGSLSWLLGNRSKTVNRIDLKYRNSAEDFRLVEYRLRDDAHVAKVHKEINEEVNGQAINNTDQAKRIASGLLAEKQDADFSYKWKSARDRDGAQVALLLQEGDVVCITDDGSGVYNIPIMIEEIEFNNETASLPVPDFTGRKYYSSLYNDSPRYSLVPIVSEPAAVP